MFPLYGCVLPTHSLPPLEGLYSPGVGYLASDLPMFLSYDMLGKDISLYTIQASNHSLSCSAISSKPCCPGFTESHPQFGGVPCVTRSIAMAIPTAAVVPVCTATPLDVNTSAHGALTPPEREVGSTKLRKHAPVDFVAVA